MLDIKGHDVAQAGDFGVQRLHALLEQIRQQTRVQRPQDVVQVAGRGNRFRHIEAIGLREVDVQTKAQFEHQQRVIEQVGTPVRGREEVFADPGVPTFLPPKIPAKKRHAWSCLHLKHRIHSEEHGPRMACAGYPGR